VANKDKGHLVYWYKRIAEEYVTSKKCWKGKGSYSQIRESKPR